MTATKLYNQPPVLEQISPTYASIKKEFFDGIREIEIENYLDPPEYTELRDYAIELQTFIKDNVVITKEEYKELENESLFLHYLKAHGVDDWYGDALEDFLKAKEYE